MKCLLSSVLMVILLQPAMAQRKYIKVSKDPMYITMIKVQGGSFDLGSDDEAADRKPAHTVKLKDFYMSAYEVTQQQWIEIMGTDPATYKCNECPVNNVTWNDAQSFIAKLNAKTGKSYRLPTEAEWEYAARGGVYERLLKRTEPTYRGGVNVLVADGERRRVPEKEMTGKKYSGKKLPQDVAWYARNSEDHVHPIGRKKPNELGIYDMSGNVEEWCSDFYATDYGGKNTVENPTGPAGGNSHVVRGGGWGSVAAEIVVTRRAAYVPGAKSSALGFRLVSDNP